LTTDIRRINVVATSDRHMATAADCELGASLKEFLNCKPNTSCIFRREDAVSILVNGGSVVVFWRVSVFAVRLWYGNFYEFESHSCVRVYTVVVGKVSMCCFKLHACIGCGY
jgi:hypothetical protein